MLGVKNFFTAIFFIGLDVILIVNIIYAFDIAHVLPSVYVGGSNQLDLTDRYFGISSLIDGFIGFFNDNSRLKGMKDSLDGLYNVLQSISLQSFINVSNSVGKNTWDILGAVISLINLFFNFYYQVVAIIYGLGLFVYAISIVVNFLLFIVAVGTGGYSLPLPHTEFPDINDILPPVEAIRYHLSFF